MDSLEQTTHDTQAEQFFATFTNPTPAQIAALEHERDGDLTRILAEDKAAGYWNQVIARRTQRRHERQQAAAAEQMRAIAAATRYAHPDPTAKKAPLPAEALALLPAPRTVTLTEEERRTSREWWQALAHAQRSRGTVIRLLAEHRDAEIQQARDARRQRITLEQWQMDQRAFERAQWRHVLQHRADRKRRRIDQRWSAISEQRALEIAAAVLAAATPPQARPKG